MVTNNRYICIFLRRFVDNVWKQTGLTEPIMAQTTTTTTQYMHNKTFGISKVNIYSARWTYNTTLYSVHIRCGIYFNHFHLNVEKRKLFYVWSERFSMLRAHISMIQMRKEWRVQQFCDVRAFNKIHFSARVVHWKKKKWGTLFHRIFLLVAYQIIIWWKKKKKENQLAVQPSS